MTLSTSKQISVIIINYRSEKNILLCLNSLKNFTDNINHEVIIVNNDQEESLNKIKKSFSEIKIIEQSRNIGFGSAVNIGLRVAKGEIIFILNPDTEIVSGKFQDVLAEFSKDESLGILGSRVVNINGQTQPWIAGVKTNLWDLLKNNMGLKKSKQIWESRQKTEADWVAATAMFIRKNLLNKLEGFDENIFMYFEDADLCKRTKDLNKKIVYFPYFVVKHLGGASFENKKIQKKYYYISQDYFFKKHCQKWETIVLRLIRKIFYAL